MSATATPEAKNGSGSSGFILPRTKKRTLMVTITGLTPLIANRMSQESQQQMIAKKTGEAVASTRTARDMEADGLATAHRVQVGDQMVFAHPSSAVFQAMIEGWAMGMPYKKKALLTGFRMASEYMVLDVKKQRVRIDALKNNNGAPDMRARLEYTEWSGVFEIVLYEQTLSVAHFLQALAFAGERVGIGPLFQRKSFGFGRFEVESVQ